jgi:2,3-bisphosphoglycerate-dependent phosphoglycerate mutase
VQVTIELIFETHSLTEDNERRIATGWLPGQLSAEGQRQARLLGERRSQSEFDVIFASDLARAVETVRTAFPSPEIPVLYDWRLRECNYGDLNGSPLDDLDYDGHLDVRYPSGASLREAVERVETFLDDLVTWWNDGRALVIGHVATYRAFERFINGHALEEQLVAPFEWQEGWAYRLG